MKKIFSIFAAAVMAFTLVGCGSSSDDKKKDDGGDTKKSLSLNLVQEPPELNSILTTSTGSGDVLRHIMEGLVTLDENDEPVPAVAESWDISDDKLTYTFHLRKGMKWSNGEEVTAHDFVFAWNQLFTPKTAAEYAGTWAPLIEGAEAVLNSKDDASLKTALENVGYKAQDDYTLEVKLTGPYDYFLGVASFYNFLPVNEKGYNDCGGQDKYAKEAKDIVTNGPFTMDKWVHEDSITFKKNPDYWQADKVKLDEIVMRMISDSNAALNEFKAGTIDMINLNGEQQKTLKEEGEDVSGYDDGGVWYLEFNTTAAGISNAKVRKALTLAVDANKYVEKVVLNESKVANALVPVAISQGKFSEFVGDLYNRPTDGKFDDVVAMFEEGLKEAGVTKEDLKLELIVDDTTQGNAYGAYVKEQLNTVLGVNLEVAPMTYKARLERMKNKDISIVLAGWGPDYNDPMTFLDLFTSTNGNNHTQWSDPDYDRIVDEARMEADTDKRNGLLKQLEEMLAEECPIGYIYYRQQNYIVSEGTTGVVRTAFSNIDVRFADKK